MHHHLHSLYSFGCTPCQPPYNTLADLAIDIEQCIKSFCERARYLNIIGQKWSITRLGCPLLVG